MPDYWLIACVKHEESPGSKGIDSC